jgi:hypothetical protein
MVFIGFCGIVTGLVLFLVIWLIAYLKTPARGKKGEVISFAFDAQGKPGAFESLLTSYLDVMKFVLSLATGSIVLLVGSSAFHSGGRLPDSMASPLFLLAAGVIYGIFFMILLPLFYEGYLHNPGAYSKPKYVLIQALGAGAILCFIVGYPWLIFTVTR